MEYNLDLNRYHKTEAKAAFGLDVRNSTKLYQFIERYGAAREDESVILRKKHSLSFYEEAANLMSMMETMGLAVTEETELEIFVDMKMEDYTKKAKEIKMFLEDKGNSAKDY